MTPFQHINRRGDVYYIKATTRGGKPAYSATRKNEKGLLDQLPEGYEVYEKPDTGQVFVRKIKPTSILPAERRQVENAVRTLSKVKHFILDEDSSSIVIYVSDAEPGASMSFLRREAPMLPEQARTMQEFMLRRATYSKMLRFELVEQEPRLFSVQRWCFLGSVDDWIYLGAGSLAKLLKTCIPHLGQESFYELF
jgi:hypothetical protein